MNDYSWASDAAERVLWTLIQVAAAAGVVAVADLQGVWVMPIATILAAIKTFAARKVGDVPDAAIGFSARKPPV